MWGFLTLLVAESDGTMFTVRPLDPWFEPDDAIWINEAPPPAATGR